SYSLGPLWRLSRYAGPMAVQIIEDKAFGRRYVLWSIGKLVPTVASFYFLWDAFANSRGRSGWQIWLGVSLFVIGILIWAFQERRMFRNYRCPRCHKHLQESTIRHLDQGDRIMFHCDDCNVTWDTTLSIGR
ncbi:MAG: hypothetical protein AAF593_13655, partial [Planctomycetota bacterium]